MMKKFPWQKVFFLSFFGIAFGWLEAVAVVYIRKIMEVENAVDMARVFATQARFNLLRMEQTREISTIVMLASLAFIVFKGWRQKVAAFLWVFALWDIFYYISLKILVNWPPSLGTVDCLFLIPCPWIAPVWFPVAASIIMLLISFVLFTKESET